MKKAVRVLSVAAISLLALAAAGILAFWLLIIVGLSPRLQTVWICSAMRTMSHQYLATMFFSDEKIDRILKENSVDDSGYDSEILDFSVPDKPSVPEKTPADGSSDTLQSAAEEALRLASQNGQSDSGSVGADLQETENTGGDPAQTEALPEESAAPPEEEALPEDGGEDPLPEPQPQEPEEEDHHIGSVESVWKREDVSVPSGWILDTLSAPVSAAEEAAATEPEKAPQQETDLPSALDKIAAAPVKDLAGAAAAEAAKAARTADSLLADGYRKLEEGLYLKEVAGLTWRGYMMLVTDPTRVRVTDTSMQWECGENVMTMVKNVGAIAGINGGGFKDGPNYDSNGGTPGGLIIVEGKLVCPLVPDDVEVYNMIGINRSGVLVLRHCTAEWALTHDIVSAVSFAPFLVVNGEGLVKNGTGGWGIAPRTAIGQRETGEMLLLVIDGRQADWSLGCDLDVLQNVMLAEGAVNAAMLDGGSSTAMVYNGAYINRPSLGHERWINNCFTVMPLPGN